MKFEVKTQNDELSKSTFSIFIAFTLISLLIVIFANISIKLGKISKFYEINYLCKIITLDKSSLNFKKLSKLTNQSSKQKIWDICREIVK